MKKIIGITLMLIGSATGAIAQSVQKTDLSIFPTPKDGYKQVVIEVPHSDKDGAKRIELLVGKWMETDGCNHYGLIGTLEKQDLQGWGYNYYNFKTDGSVFSTQKGCLDTVKKNEFVYGPSEIIAYNGRLPIVIYIPEDHEVKFRIYVSDGDLYQASEVRSKK